MVSAFDVFFYVLTLVILFLLAWRPIILPLIAKVCPELWLILNEPVDYDKMKALVAERKEKRGKKE